MSDKVTPLSTEEIAAARPQIVRARVCGTLAEIDLANSLDRALETIRQLQAERYAQKKLIDDTADGAILIIETCRKEFPKVGLELSPNPRTVVECFDALMQECLDLRAELAKRKSDDAGL